MVAIKIAKSASSDVTDITLKHAPARLLQFLQAMSDPVIRTKFNAINWSDERGNEGWALLEELRVASVAKPVATENPVTEAITQCEEWQSTGLVRARAMLQMTHPEQAQFLFHDFVSGPGMEAVLNVATFLNRRGLLTRSAERKATHRADVESLSVLEQVGITKDELKKLEKIVSTAQSAPAALSDDTEQSEIESERREVLRKIHVWITGWSDMARTVITRRDQAIKLGIAKRRARKAKAVVVPPVVTPPAPTPTPAPAPAPSDDSGPNSQAA